MIVLHVGLVLFVSVALVNTKERNETCTTPNSETGACISVFSCAPIREAIATFDATAIDFAKKSQCGYDAEPLVCCGSVGYQQESTTSKKHIPIELAEITRNALPDRSICGVEQESARLTSGKFTKIKEFPWMALIHYKNDDGTDAGFKCGGTLINSRFVLTAAHCILVYPETFKADSVRLGEWRISTKNDCQRDIAIETCADPVEDVEIEEQISHAYFSSSDGNNDIALIRLARDVKYTTYIIPICLPPFDLPPPAAGEIMTVCGWGATETSSLSDFKLKITVPIVDYPECKLKISNYTKISSNQICAGGVSGVDTCQGDSGGPLMRTYTDDTSQWYQEGIVSRGRGCGRFGVPGIYTRVSRYMAWIVNTIADY